MSAWSYSNIKLFEQCPKKYYHLRVAKDVKELESRALSYGHEVHKAAELYVKNGTPLPPKFSYLTPVMESITNIEGEKFCELKLGVTEDLKPTTFFSKDVWYRGIVDLLVVRDSSAYIIDYKTGKNAKYADTTQLDVMAAATFAHYGEVDMIKSALVYTTSGEFITKPPHRRELVKSYWNIFEPQLDRLQVAEETNVWNAVSGPLCKYCPVTKCPHNRS